MVYCQIFTNIRPTIVSGDIAYHSDAVGASPVVAAPTTSSFSTQHLASIDCTKKNARRDDKRESFWGLVRLILEISQ